VSSDKPKKGVDTNSKKETINSPKKKGREKKREEDNAVGDKIRGGNWVFKAKTRNGN